MFYKAISRGVTRPSVDKLRQLARFNRAVHSYRKSDNVKLNERDNVAR